MRNYLVEKKNNNLFDEVFGDFFRPAFYEEGSGYMATDVKHTENGYELEVDMPGYVKENIEISFEKGYLTIGAKSESKETDDKYISRERQTACRRSYYIGEVNTDAISAKYNNGVLTVVLPKKEEVREAGRKIAIE